MFNVPVSVQVSSSNAVTAFKHDTSNAPTDVIHSLINEKDEYGDHFTGVLNCNNKDGKKTPRGPPPVPPPKPPDLMKKGVSTTNIQSSLAQINSNKVQSINRNPAPYNSSKKPIKPPKPVGLLNKLNNHADASPIANQCVNPPDLNNADGIEILNGSQIDRVVAVGADEVMDENANVSEPEHITNSHESSGNNQLTHHDSFSDSGNLEKVVTARNINGFNSMARDELPLSNSSSQCNNAGNVSRETTSSNCKLSNSSSFINRDSSSISRSMSTISSVSNSGLNRRNSNIERITSQITTSHIKRSFSARSEFQPIKMLGTSPSSLSPSPGVIQPAKSTASVDSDDSSDEMDVKIELSVGLQRELRQFLEKRRFKETTSNNKLGTTSRQTSRGSVERESGKEGLLRQQLLERVTASKAPSSASASFSQPPTLDNNDDQADSCEERKVIGKESQQVTVPDEEEECDVGGGGLDQEEVKRRKVQQKLYFIAKEITSSEADFVDKLHLLNNEFRAVAEKHLPPEALKSELQLLKYLPQLTTLSENFLSELQTALDSWPKTHKIAHVIVKIGPFLKHYSSFIQEFDKSSSQLDEAVRKYPNFAAGLRELEATPRCGKLLIKHYLLKPIQRIPQYRLLLQDYKKNLPDGHPDEMDTETALKIVSDVAEHANNTMKQCENFVKLQAIQSNLLGNHEIIKPGRILLKEGDMFKRSRRSLQPRRFILCSDCLLYMTLLQTGTYRLNHEIPLSGMRIILPQQYDFKSELTIRSTKRSFTIVANDESERDMWYDAIHKAIIDHNCRRNTLSNSLSLPTNESIANGGGSRPSSGSSTEPTPSHGISLGDEQPVWIPDSRVTMCQLCTAEFSLTFRRHHCRACGMVVCVACSSNRAPLKYLDYKPSRVCDECNTFLINRILERKQRKKSLNGNDDGSERGSISSQTNLDDTPEVTEDANGVDDDEPEEEQLSMFTRVTVDKTRASQRVRKIPDIRKVPANDSNAEMSGYLLLREKKKTWNKFWFMVKELDTDIKILYKFKESEDIAALDSIPLLGWYVSTISGPIDGHSESLLFQLTHPGIPSYIFKAEDECSKNRWMKAMEDCIKV